MSFAIVVFCLPLEAMSAHCNRDTVRVTETLPSGTPVLTGIYTC